MYSSPARRLAFVALTRSVRRRTRALSVSLCLVLSSILARAQDAPADQTLHGTVINSITREPIPRALVTAMGNLVAGFTDDQGNFSFMLPPAKHSGSGDVQVRKPGFLQDENSRIVFSFSSKEAQDLALALTPESLIVGRVRLPAAGNSERINLQLYRRDVFEGRSRWQMFRETQARSNGEFRFAGLSAGTYKLFTLELADRDPLDLNPDGPQFGYPPSYYPAATDFSSAAPISLSTGQTFEAELTPTLHQYFQVRISLPNAPPGLHGAEINVSPNDHAGPGFSLGFYPRNQTITGELPNGTYTVEATTYQPRMSGVTTFTVHDGPMLTPVLLLASSPIIPVRIKQEFSKTNNAHISAIVSFGAPGSSRSRPMQIPLAQVTLIPADELARPRSAGFEPNPDGTIDPRISAEPGRYWLQIYPQQGYVASAASAGVDLLLNPLAVSPGGSDPIDLTLRDDFAEIHGTVEGTDPEKDKLSSLPFVYCMPLPDSPGKFQPAQTARTEADVTFSCPSLAPGSYRVLAFEHPQPDFEYRNPEAMRPFESKGPVVRVSGAQKESVRIPLNP